MMDVLTRLKWFDGLVVGLGVLLLALLAQKNVVLAPFTPERDVQYFGRALEGEYQRAAYHDFAKGNNFGAFAIGPGDTFGWSYSHNTLRGAKSNATAHCEAQGGPCELVATIVPKGYDPAVGLALRPRDHHNLRNLMSETGPRAMAIAENGAYGAGYGITIWGAKLDAWAGCMSRRNENQPEYLQIWPCRIVYASW